MIATGVLAFDTDGWAKIVVGLAFLVVGVGRVTSGRENPDTIARNLRGTFLVGLALCVVFSVLVVLGALSDGIVYDEDFILLAVCWGVLALAWIASRYIPAFMRRRAGDA